MSEHYVDYLQYLPSHLGLALCPVTSGAECTSFVFGPRSFP